MYSITLKDDDIELVVSVVNQGIDSHLQAVTESTFEPIWDYGPALKCEISWKDLSVILKRLLEHGSEEADMLAGDIAGTLTIDDLYLTDDDRFCFYFGNDYCSVSVFDEDWLERLNDTNR